MGVCTIGEIWGVGEIDLRGVDTDLNTEYVWIRRRFRTSFSNATTSTTPFLSVKPKLSSCARNTILLNSTSTVLQLKPNLERSRAWLDRSSCAARARVSHNWDEAADLGQRASCLDDLCTISRLLNIISGVHLNGSAPYSDHLRYSTAGQRVHKFSGP